MIFHVITSCRSSTLQGALFVVLPSMFPFNVFSNFNSGHLASWLRRFLLRHDTCSMENFRYKFTLTEGGKVTPRIPILNERMYDSEFESQFYMLCDSNKVWAISAFSICTLHLSSYLASQYSHIFQINYWDTLCCNRSAFCSTYSPGLQAPLLAM